MIFKLVVLLFFSPFVRNQKNLSVNQLHLFDEFPKLKDILPTLVQKTSVDYDNIPGVIIKNISIDIEKLNIEKIRTKIDAMASAMAKEEPKLNASRRQAFIDENSYNYFQGLRQMLRRKCLDLMLQVLYMTRHKIRKLQAGKYYSTTDTGFRIAYTYRLLVRLFRRMMRFYSHLLRHDLTQIDFPTVPIVIHGKLTRLHVDFLYLWWVLIKVDGAYRLATNVRSEKKRMEGMVQEQLDKTKKKDPIIDNPSEDTESLRRRKTSAHRWLGPPDQQRYDPAGPHWPQPIRRQRPDSSAQDSLGPVGRQRLAYPGELWPGTSVQQGLRPAGRQLPWPTDQRLPGPTDKQWPGSSAQQWFRPAGQQWQAPIGQQWPGSSAQQWSKSAGQQRPGPTNLAPELQPQWSLKGPSYK